jgi:hypothetical protein
MGSGEGTRCQKDGLHLIVHLENSGCHRNYTHQHAKTVQERDVNDSSWRAFPMICILCRSHDLAAPSNYRLAGALTAPYNHLLQVDRVGSSPPVGLRNPTLEHDMGKIYMGMKDLLRELCEHIWGQSSSGLLLYFVTNYLTTLL